MSPMRIALAPLNTSLALFGHLLVSLQHNLEWNKLNELDHVYFHTNFNFYFFYVFWREAGGGPGPPSWVMIYFAHRVASVNYLDTLWCLRIKRHLPRRECPRAGSGWAWPRTLQWQCVKVTSTTTSTRVILIVCLNREHEATCQTSLHNLQLATFCRVCNFKYLN